MMPSPTRVLFVIPDLRVGGSQRHLVTLVAQMNRKRITSSVLCIGDEGELFEELHYHDIRANALHLGGKKNALRALNSLVRHMRSDRPDVVVVEGFNAEVLGRIAAAIAGIPHTVLWLHNVRPRTVFRKKIDKFLDWATSSYFGVAEVQRRYMSDELGYPSRKIIIIRNGVDHNAFDCSGGRHAVSGLDIGRNRPVVSILAALRPEKDHATFIRGARLVLNEIPDADFLIVGDGPQRADLEALCSELGLSDNVRFLGTRSDVPEIICATDLMVLTSVTEAMPMVILEAMACGKPVVATDVGGVGELVEDGVTGFLVPPKEPAALAERLIELIRDPAKCRTMGLAGRRRVLSDFTLEQSVRTAETAITMLVSKQTGS